MHVTQKVVEVQSKFYWSSRGTYRSCYQRPLFIINTNTQTCNTRSIDWLYPNAPLFCFSWTDFRICHHWIRIKFPSSYLKKMVRIVYFKTITHYAGNPKTHFFENKFVSKAIPVLVEILKKINYGLHLNKTPTSTSLQITNTNPLLIRDVATLIHQIEKVPPFSKSPNFMLAHQPTGSLRLHQNRQWSNTCISTNPRQNPTSPQRKTTRSYMRTQRHLWRRISSPSRNRLWLWRQSSTPTLYLFSYTHTI